MPTARPLTPTDGPVLEALFGPRGACGGCWCMYWRLPGPVFEAGKGEPHRTAFLSAVAAGEVTGVLAFDVEEAVGWCSVGPRADFVRLARGRSFRKDAPADAWSVNCFFVPAAHRGAGVASLLLAEAVALAARSGAGELEAYPKRPGADGKMPAAFAFTGVEAMFAGAGFRPIAEGAKTWVRALPG